MKYAVSMRTLYGITGYNFTKSIFSVAILLPVGSILSVSAVSVCTLK